MSGLRTSARSSIGSRLRLPLLALVLAATGLGTVVTPAHAIRVVTYNLLNYPNQSASREPDFRTVFQNMPQMDIVCVQEVQSDGAMTEFQGDVLNTVEPETWLKAIECHGHRTRHRRTVAAGERLDEILMMGLRLTAGNPWQTLARLAGGQPEQMLDGDRVARLTAAGFLVLDKAGLRATPTDLLRLDAVLAALTA